MSRRPRRRGRGPELDIVEGGRSLGWVAYRIAHGAADVIWLRAGARPRFIQVKSTAGGPYERFRPVDREVLLREARLAGADAWLAWWPPHLKAPRWIPSDEWPTAQLSLPIPDPGAPVHRP